ncbi:CAF1-domain-containing protein [Lophiostoma macrostomum CBS 122681]|uniref:CAF1-domain-containing protein n=1 Tax=Lophiostoma macrostomum CBS 122681 TaxID=1314788 RepID=A0A6A6SKZ3_9PLEO|nr:CAF1-domain-containing protein [Lophiostoma macrostomum CBS 122681]
MEVDADSFPHHLLGILIAISEADFVSFDLELSGIPSRMPGKPRSNKRQTLEDRYLEAKAGAEKYQILQVGITCARFDYIANKYVLRPYNINISPLVDERLDLERDVSLQTGAIKFLLQNNFRMDLPFTNGVQYLSRDEAARVKQHQYARFEKKNDTPDLQLKDTDVESLDFVQRARDAISAWKESKEPALYITTHTGFPISERPALPVISRFEKRLVHQLVRAEFADLVTIGRNECIKIMPYDAVREADNTHRLKQRVKEQITRQTGFRWIIEAMAMSQGSIHPIDPIYFARTSTGEVIAANLNAIKDRFDRAVMRLKDRKTGVLVGHNMFTDIVYLYRTFIGELPPTLDEFSDAVHSIFPRIADTKYLATYNTGDLNASPTLQEIAEGLQSQQLPDIVTHADHSKYHDTTAFHEAGYDSLLTATILLRLSARISAETTPVTTLLAGEQDSDTDSKLSFKTATEDTVPPPALIDGREHVSAPVSLPPVVNSCSVAEPGKKRKNKKKRKSQPQPTSNSPPTTTSSDSRFGSRNLFDALEESIQSSSDIPSISHDDAQVDGTADWRNQSPERYDKDWAPLPKIERKPMELIPSFDDDSQFWNKFGNRLRIFGTEEKVLHIAEWE